MKFSPAVRLGSRVPVVLLAVLLAVPGMPTRALEPEVHQRIDAIFSDLDSVKSPGCAVGVIQNRQLVYRRGYGMVSLEHGVPIDEHTVFYTGSVSKQFTAAAVAMAAREGHLSLDDDIRTWFPPRSPTMVRPSRSATSFTIRADCGTTWG